MISYFFESGGNKFSVDPSSLDDVLITVNRDIISYQVQVDDIQPSKTYRKIDLSDLFEKWDDILSI